MTGILVRKGVRTQTHTEGGSCEDSGRRQPSTSQGECLSEEMNPANTLDFQPPELRGTKFFRLSHSVCGPLLLHPKQTNTGAMSTNVPQGCEKQ